MTSTSLNCGRANGLSLRGIHTANYTNRMLTYGDRFRDDPYRKMTNPKGIICMGIAADNLCDDLLLQRLNDKSMPKIEPEMLGHFPDRGIPGIHQTVADFLEEHLKTAPLNPEHIVITSGACSGVELLAHAVADPGECFLCLAPYYGMTQGDLNARCMVTCYPIQLPTEDSEENLAFIPTKDILEDGFAKANMEGHTVRGLFIINPSNPTGDVYSQETVRDILTFCHKHNLHVIFDELYALSVLDKDIKFTSVLSMDLPDPSRVHFVYGVSKDFNLAGFHFGMLHTQNKAVLQSVSSCVRFQKVSSYIQHLMKALLSDKDWLNQVCLPTKQKRLNAAHDFCYELLSSFNVKVRRSKATCFLWANFAEFLDSTNPDDEENLCQEFLQAGVFVVPGGAFFANQRGWFRLTYSIPRDQVELGIERIKKVLQLRRSRQRQQ